MIQCAIENEIGKRFIEPLRDMLLSFKSTFSTRISSTPSKVDPLHIERIPVSSPM